MDADTPGGCAAERSPEQNQNGRNFGDSRHELHKAKMPYVILVENT